METKLELNPNKNIYNENPIFSKCTWPASSQNACPDNCWINPDGTMSEKTKEGGFCASPHKRFKCWKFDKEASCDIGLTENGENPVMETKQDGCTLTCTFDTTKIRTPEQWKNLTWKFNLTDDQKQQVLFSYCALDSKEDCAAINGIVPNSCSRLVSKNFQECNILNNEKNSFTDAIKQNYAANYPDNLDTACLNRANDKVYQKIKNGLSASTNDGCWYTACTNSVIPRLSDINADNCPTNMCMQIYNIDNVTKAEISGNKNIIDCTSPSPPPSPTPTPSPSPTATPTPTPAEEVITWRMQSYVGPKDAPKYMGIADNIEQMSNGRLTIDWYHGGELVPSKEILDAVSSGIVEMGYGSGSYWTGTIPLAKLEAPPMGWTDLSQAIRFWYTLDMLGLTRDAYAKHNVFYLNPSYETPYAMLSTKSATTLDDLKSMKIRVAGTFGEVLGGLGISTTYLPAEEIYTSLATGIVDACIYSGAFCYWSNSWYEVAKYYNTSYLLCPYTANWLVNMDAWNALPDDLKAIVQTACDKQTIFSQYTAWGQELECQQLMVGEGVTIQSLTDATVTAITEASAEYWEEVGAESPESAQAVKLLLQMKREYGIVE